MTIHSAKGDEKPYCSFYVGQRVVCVDAKPRPGFTKGPGCVEGVVYTVAAIRIWARRNTHVIDLVEISRNEQAVRLWGPSCGFGAFRFRPATDISKLEEIARTAKLPADFDHALGEVVS